MKRAIFTTLMICAFCLAALAQDEEPLCPSINVIGPSSAPLLDEPMQFSADVGQVIERYNVEYVWSISSGKIVSGQGSKILTVIDGPGESMTVTLKIKGLPEKCPNTASETAPIADHTRPILIDEFENSGRTGTRGRIDAFLLELQKDKNSEGVVVFRDDKDVLFHIKYLRNHLAFRHFPPARLTVVVSDKYDQRTQFWRVPVYFDISNWTDGLIFKLEDFEQLQKLFQPKPAKSKNKK